MPDPGKNLDVIVFDLHPATAAIASLAALQLIVDEMEIDSKMRRNSF